MDIAVGLSLYTVMIGVITLLGGFYYVVGSRLVVELSEFIGRSWFWRTSYEEYVDELDKGYVSLMGRIREVIERRVDDVDLRRELGERLGGVEVSFGGGMKKMRVGVGELHNVLSDVGDMRKGFVNRMFFDLVVILVGVVVFVVLLSVVGSDNWVYGVWVAWGVFVVELVYCLRALWCMVDLSNETFEMLRSSEMIVEDICGVVGGERRSYLEELRRLGEKLLKKEGGGGVG